MNALRRLQELGQSVYLDEIRRAWLDDGTLQAMIDGDGLRGVTSNPAIFHKAITESADYDEAIAQLARDGVSATAAYETLVVEDIERAADLFRPTWDASEGRYGYVSLEVSPMLAHDSDGTLDEARRLWRRLARPNVFIKVPGTRAGLPAIRQLTAEGINVNVTLLFGLGRYREVAEAYLCGLEERLAAGHAVARTASVASFFLSRIDVLVDPMLEDIVRQGGERAKTAQSLRGEIAIASARRAYRIYQDLFSEARFRALAARGARAQRLLWASTSTKNPAYSDVKYVEPLIGRGTINTMPRETLDAYRDHGDPAERLGLEAEAAARRLAGLTELGLDLDALTRQLEEEGVQKFVKPYEALLQAIGEALARTKPGARP